MEKGWGGGEGFYYINDNIFAKDISRSCAQKFVHVAHLLQK